MTIPDLICVSSVVTYLRCVLTEDTSLRTSQHVIEPIRASQKPNLQAVLGSAVGMHELRSSSAG